MILCACVLTHDGAAECGNQICEYGELCTNPSCGSGCPADCPAYAGVLCPSGVNAAGIQQSCSGHGTCQQYSGMCMCHVGYLGNECGSCAPDFLRVMANGPCIMIPGSQTSCSDGVKNGNELGVDCGGPNCPACAAHMMSPFLIAYIGAGAVCAAALAFIVIRRVRSKASGTVAPEKPTTKVASGKAVATSGVHPVGTPRAVGGTPRGLGTPRKATPVAHSVKPIQVMASSGRQRGSIIDWVRSNGTHNSTGTTKTASTAVSYGGPAAGLPSTPRGKPGPYNGSMHNLSVGVNWSAREMTIRSPAHGLPASATKGSNRDLNLWL